MTRLRGLMLAGLLLALFPLDTFAQDPPEPIGRFAADLRAAMPNFPDDGAIANAIAVPEDNLPGRGLGLSAGLHVYPLRMGKVTLGIGGELLIARASRTLEPEDDGGTPGPTVSSRFTSLSPQVSLNFGSRRGWSYLSAGFGFGGLTIENDAAPVASPDGRLGTINYGGGARWFAQEHLAFTFDVRFHRYGAQEAIVGRPAYPGGRILVLSAGISVK